MSYYPSVNAVNGFLRSVPWLWLWGWEISALCSHTAEGELVFNLVPNGGNAPKRSAHRCLSFLWSLHVKAETWTPGDWYCPWEAQLSNCTGSVIFRWHPAIRQSLVRCCLPGAAWRVGCADVLVVRGRIGECLGLFQSKDVTGIAGQLENG